MNLLLSMAYWLIWNWVAWGAINFLGRPWPEIRGVASTIVRQGVYFHEFFHYLMMKILWIKVSLADIRIEGEAGAVTFRTTGKESPLKITLMAVAPWVLGTLLINNVLFFFATVSSPVLAYALLLFLLKWWMVGMLVLVLPPSKGDFRLIFQTIAARWGVFVKQVLLIIAAFYAYGYNLLNVAAIREWVFGLELVYGYWFHSFVNPLVEYGVILLLFGLFDLLVWLTARGLNAVYHYYSKDRKFAGRPLNYLAYLGNEFMKTAVEEKPRYGGPHDESPSPRSHDAQIKELFLAEMRKNHSAGGFP